MSHKQKVGVTITILVSVVIVTCCFSFKWGRLGKIKREDNIPLITFSQISRDYAGKQVRLRGYFPDLYTTGLYHCIVDIPMGLSDNRDNISLCYLDIEGIPLYHSNLIEVNGVLDFKNDIPMLKSVTYSDVKPNTKTEHEYADLANSGVLNDIWSNITYIKSRASYGVAMESESKKLSSERGISYEDAHKYLVNCNKDWGSDIIHLEVYLSALNWFNKHTDPCYIPYKDLLKQVKMEIDKYNILVGDKTFYDMTSKDLKSCMGVSDKITTTFYNLLEKYKVG